MSWLLASRRRTYAVVAAACALPRLAVLLHERAGVLANFEKSDLLAQMYLKTGTFGYVPGHPSAYTQPLYGWFLVVLFWVAGFHWWSVGVAQTLVAIGTSVTVFEIGRRFISARIGLIAAVIATVHPYLVWHDIHGNREILDQLLGAAMFGLTLLLSSRPSLRCGVLLGLVSGVAILSNTRLVLLPFVLGIFLLRHRSGWLIAATIPILAGVAMSPWVIRNKVDVGCWAITTDARSLWKANNANTYSTLARGQWIDQVLDIPQRQNGMRPPEWITAQEAGNDYTTRGKIDSVDECAQEAAYEHMVVKFWEHHPGEKVKLAAQATQMLWDPRVGIEGAQESGVDSLRAWVEPAYMIPLYLLAIVGLFLVSPTVRALSLIFAGYETLTAWVFVGTTRYRVPWDFVLALLAAATLDRVLRALRRKRRPAA